MLEDFFSEYLDYTSNIEPPAVFQRWCAISGIGAFLGRQYYFQHGHFNVYPNTYTMLIGSPGTRKSTAIKLMRSLMVQAGYGTIAAEKSTKEKFLLDLAGEDNGMPDVDAILDRNIFGDGDDKSATEMFIMADEFNDFFGNGNIEFVSLLGTLWDFNGTYRNRIKNGKSVDINNPTVSILGGNTPTGFSLAFPTDILGQGFFSRILLIYGEPNGKRIPFPERPSDEATKRLIERLQRIKANVFGPANLTGNAKKLLDKIYRLNPTVDDVRFESYSNRRFIHLLKLCIIHSAARDSCDIHEQDVIYANTVLTHSESFMPRALGEFGKGKNSDVSHKVLQVIMGAPGVISFKDIWCNVHSDLEKMSQLQEILVNLNAADKIQAVPNLNGYLPKRRVVEVEDDSIVDYSLLSAEERRMTK